MSDTRIGRSSIRTQHGLSRFGRRSVRDAKHGQYAARAATVVGAEVGSESTGLAAPALLTADLDLDFVVAESATEVLAHVPAEVLVPAEPVALVPDLETTREPVTVPLAPRRAQTFVLPVAGALGVVAALAVGAPVVPALALALCWLAIAVQQSPSQLLPGQVAWRGLLPAASGAVAVAGLTVGLLGAARMLVAQSLALVAVASCVAVLARVLRSAPRRRVVLVGSGADLATAAARWLGHADLQVVGALLTAREGDVDDAGLDTLVESLGVPVAHEATGLGDLLDRTHAELVVVCGQVEEAALRQTAWQVESRPVGLALAGPLDAVSPHRLVVTSFGGATLTHVRSSRPSRAGTLAKSALDRLVGLTLLAAVAPIMAVLALWIRLDSPGPVFFRQTRVGHHGRHFTMWKLRTMVVDAERIKATLATQNEGSGLLFKMQHDPRITASGRVLRKLSLDELPQLINVVLGHMSLVGPRPALPVEVARYDAVTRRRLASKPGITGLWQVSGRSDLSWDESVRLDLHYTDNWRIRDDALILMRTAGAVLNARGAY